MYERPDPDALLARLNADASSSSRREKGRGSLSIFFGYAAGVGKTYAMLKAARAAQAEGKNILVGYVEPHARPDTLALLDGLPQLAPLSIAYRGISLHEFDVDTALDRGAGIMLVDEMAHSNAEGCRNRKRYQDIEELLQAGISVWTTLNVQHLESLHDLVASLTGVRVRERVPDRLFDSAVTVKLVDIEPDELIHRLEEGKIYSGVQAGSAIRHFFQSENLVALREIALRRMADRVNLLAVAEQEAGSSRRPVREHILVCLSGAPSNARVIRTAARMAEAFHGELTALFVETAEARRRGGEALRAHFRLAEELGAHVATVQGQDVPGAIAAYARRNGVQKLVTGRSPAPHGLFAHYKSLVERLSDLAPDIDMYIIPDSGAPISQDRRRKGGKFAKFRHTAPNSGRLWGLTLVVLAACSFLGWGMRVIGLHDASIVGVFFAGVLGIAVLTKGPWYGVVASLAGVFLFDFFCTVPYFSFHVKDPGYLATFATMLLVSLVSSALTARSRAQAQQNAARALYTELLLGNSRRLLKMESEPALLAETGRQLSGLLGRAVSIHPVRDGVPELRQVFLPNHPSGSGPSPADEPGVVQWVMKNGREAGVGTDTLPGARCLYLPMRGDSAVLAVVGLACRLRDEEPEPLETDELNLARALIGECAVSVERERLIRANAVIAGQVQQERLRADILRAVSHDLRTPLTAISGNANVLRTEGEALDAGKRRLLASVIEDDSLRLIHMVENLLAMTRLEQQEFALHLRPELIEDIVSDACASVRRCTGNHPVSIELEDDLLMAWMDAGLMVQVLVNLLTNAITHTPDGTPILISVRGEGEWIHIAVSDTGPGISDSEKKQIFQRFSLSGKPRSDGRRGMGLGLALCRSIVSAHGGTISVRDNIPHGAVFAFTLRREHGEGEDDERRV